MRKKLQVQGGSKDLRIGKREGLSLRETADPLVCGHIPRYGIGPFRAKLRKGFAWLAASPARQQQAEPGAVWRAFEEQFHLDSSHPD